MSHFSHSPACKTRFLQGRLGLDMVQSVTILAGQAEAIWAGSPALGQSQEWEVVLDNR